MDFYDKIDKVLEERRITRKQLAFEINMPYSSLASAFLRKSTSLPLSAAFAVARVLDVSIDYLMRDEITDPNYGIKPNDIISSDAEIDVVDMINAETGWDNDDVAFVQAYQRLPKESRKVFRDSLWTLVGVANNMKK